MNRLADARARVHAALSVVVTDEIGVSPYPRTVADGVPPMVWIEQPSISTRSTSGGTTSIVAGFPVHIAYDGTDAAQVAGVDELVAKCWDAFEAAKGLTPRSSRPSPVSIEQARWRHAVIDVDASIAARTFCTPDVVVASVPPETVQPEED